MSTPWRRSGALPWRWWRYHDMFERGPDQPAIEYHTDEEHAHWVMKQEFDREEGHSKPTE